jgi:putative DNA primase/helicase
VSNPIELVLGRFPDAAREGDSWRARCPIHDDKHPSLRISEAVDGTVLIKCRVCGKDRTKDILAAVGLSFPDLFQKADRVTASAPNRTPAARVAKPKPNGSGELVHVYVYEDQRRQPIAEKHRFHHPDGSKTFLQKRHGATDWGLNGTHLPLYRLADVKEARPEWPIAICEGEKDADALRLLGLVATTNAEGATTWRPEHSDTLRGRRVFILEDNDEAGRERTRILVKALSGVVSELKVIALAGLPEKGDVSDWLEAGHSRDELIEIVKLPRR